MTIEELLECSAAQLKAMTDEQLMEHFKKYLDVTRPERVQANKPKQEQLIYIPPTKAAALKMLEDQGVDLSFLRKKFRTR